MKVGGVFGLTPRAVSTSLGSGGRAPSARPPRERNSTNRRTNNMVAADGFDFSKPYESATPPPAAAQTEGKPASTPEHPHQRRRPVAALLGGLGRK